MADATMTTTYLDHAATTPVYPEVIDVMAEHLAGVGNPSSSHGSGRAARRVVEDAREAVADALGARPFDVVFTSGGTEADNLAVKGLYWARHKENRRRTRVLTTAIEHHAVLDSVQWIGADAGGRAELLPVDESGRLDVRALRTSVEQDPESVALISVMWANNEVGTVQPIEEVTAIAAEHGIPVHSDAVQAVGHVPVDFVASQLDAMTVTGHKVGGPVGVGALLLRRELEPVALLHGGGQEREVRSGTLDVAGIAGFGVAVRRAVEGQPDRAVRLAALRDRLEAVVRAATPEVRVNGGHDADRLPGNLHVSFPGCLGDMLLMLLDAEGVECSTGSACSAGVSQASHVLLAMGRSEEAARGSLRFSLGHTSTEADVDRVGEVIGTVVERARAAGAVAGLGSGAMA